MLMLIDQSSYIGTQIVESLNVVFFDLPKISLHIISFELKYFILLRFQYLIAINAKIEVFLTGQNLYFYCHFWPNLIYLSSTASALLSTTSEFVALTPKWNPLDTALFAKSDYFTTFLPSTVSLTRSVFSIISK